MRVERADRALRALLLGGRGWWAGVREALGGRRRQRRRHVPGCDGRSGKGRRRAPQRVTAERAFESLGNRACEPSGRPDRHARGRGSRLPAPADAVLRDVGPRHRDQVHDVDRRRRDGTARRRGHDPDRGAVRSHQPGHERPRRPRRRRCQSGDPRVGLCDDHGEGAEPGSVPVGFERHAGGRGERGRGDRSAARGQEGRVCGRRAQTAEAQVRRGVHPDVDRRRPVRARPRGVRRDVGVGQRVPQQRRLHRGGRARPGAGTRHRDAR